MSGSRNPHIPNISLSNTATSTSRHMIRSTPPPPRSPTQTMYQIPGAFPPTYPAPIPKSVSFDIPDASVASAQPSAVAEPNPIIIAVFGKTGTGKTSFIQSVTGMEMRVGHGLESCEEISVYKR